jgi:hypothetical protein
MAGRNQPLGGLIKEGRVKVKNGIYEAHGGEVSKLQYAADWAKFLWFSATHLTGPDDYFVNRLYRKSRRELKNFITLGKMYKLRRIYNYDGDYDKFNNKVRFNSTFGKYIKRDWIEPSSATEEEFENFVKKHGRFICKPKELGGGRGVHICEYTDQPIAELKREYSDYILEELIKQHDKLAEINPHCVNTFRITTIKEDDEVYIISAMFRCGTRDIPVDNWYQGGITAAVDIETGRIFTKGVAKVPKRTEYLRHPVSGVYFPGFQVPFWPETVEMVKSIAGEVDDVRLVGWDVAITNEGPCVVEGNHRSNTTILSVADDIGKYKVIKDIREAHGKKMRSDRRRLRK